MVKRQSKRERREAARRAHIRRKRIRWAGALVVLIVAVVGVVLFSGSDDYQAGAVAPDFELESPDGGTVRLSDYRGQPVALTFMHTY